MSESTERDLPERISRECGTPAHWIEVREDYSVFLKPDASADLKKVKRVMEALRKQGIPYGFVGNRAWSGIDPFPPEQDG